MQSRIHLDPERVESTFGQRFVSNLAGKHPCPGFRSGETARQLPRLLAEQNTPRSRLAVIQGKSVGPDLALVEAAFLPRPASGQQDVPHHHDADPAFRFAQAQDRSEPCQIIRADPPPVRRLSRKRRGSRRGEKRRAHERLANARRNSQHHALKRLAANVQTFVLEALSSRLTSGKRMLTGTPNVMHTASRAVRTIWMTRI